MIHEHYLESRLSPDGEIAPTADPFHPGQEWTALDPFWRESNRDAARFVVPNLLESGYDIRRRSSVTAVARRARRRAHRGHGAAGARALVPVHDRSGVDVRAGATRLRPAHQSRARAVVRSRRRGTFVQLRLGARLPAPPRPARAIRSGTRHRPRPRPSPNRVARTPFARLPPTVNSPRTRSRSPRSRSATAPRRAVDGISFTIDDRRGVRPARAERRGQDDDRRDPRGLPPRRRRRRARARRRPVARRRAAAAPDRRDAPGRRAVPGGAAARGARSCSRPTTTTPTTPTGCSTSSASATSRAHPRAPACRAGSSSGSRSRSR